MMVTWWLFVTLLTVGEGEPIPVLTVVPDRELCEVMRKAQEAKAKKPEGMGAEVSAECKPLNDKPAETPGTKI